MAPPTIILVAALAALGSVVFANPCSETPWDGNRPAPGMECCVNIQPNEADCKEIIRDNRYFGSGDEMDVCVNPRACRVFRSGNCRISLCNNEDYEACSKNTQWGQRTDDLMDFCVSKGEGGFESAGEPAPWTEVALRANIDWLMSAYSAGASASLHHPSEVTYEEISTMENAAEVARLNAFLNAKGHPKTLLARDETFEVGNRRIGTTKPGAQKDMSKPLDNGDQWTMEESEAQTEGITASFSLSSDLFNVFTASLGLDVSSSYTVTSTVGITKTIDCQPGQRGVIVWFPSFDYYEGTFQPSGRSGYIWIPQSGAASQSTYRVRCVG